MLARFAIALSVSADEILGIAKSKSGNGTTKNRRLLRRLHQIDKAPQARSGRTATHHRRLSFQNCLSKMAGAVSVLIAMLSLSVSLAVAWLTLVHRGRLRMTRPSLVVLTRADGPDPEAPKIFMRMMLYSTGKRGHVVENLFAKVRRAESTQPFLFWSYGETNKLSVGSGIYVNQGGHVANHHFLLTAESRDYRLLAGKLTIDVYAVFDRDEQPTLLRSIDIFLPEEAAKALLNDSGAVLFFAWDPEAGKYRSRVNSRSHSAPRLPAAGQ